MPPQPETTGNVPLPLAYTQQYRNYLEEKKRQIAQQNAVQITTQVAQQQIQTQTTNQSILSRLKSEYGERVGGEIYQLYLSEQELERLKKSGASTQEIRNAELQVAEQRRSLESVSPRIPNAKGPGITTTITRKSGVKEVYVSNQKPTIIGPSNTIETINNGLNYSPAIPISIQPKQIAYTPAPANDILRGYPASGPLFGGELIPTKKGVGEQFPASFNTGEKQVTVLVREQQQTTPAVFDIEAAKQNALNFAAPRIRLVKTEQQEKELAKLGITNPNPRVILPFPGAAGLLFAGEAATAGFISGGFKPFVRTETTKFFGNNELIGEASTIGLDILAIGGLTRVTTKFGEIFFPIRNVDIEISTTGKQKIGSAGGSSGLVEKIGEGKIIISRLPKEFTEYKVVDKLNLRSGGLNESSGFRFSPITSPIITKAKTGLVRTAKELFVEEKPLQANLEVVIGKTPVRTGSTVIPEEFERELTKEVATIPKKGFISDVRALSGGVPARAEVSPQASVIKSQVDQEFFVNRQIGIIRFGDEKFFVGTTNIQRTQNIPTFQLGKNFVSQQPIEGEIFGRFGDIGSRGQPIERELTRRVGDIGSYGRTGTVLPIRTIDKQLVGFDVRESEILQEFPDLEYGMRSDISKKIGSFNSTNNSWRNNWAGR